jgi:hypothetical protein
MSQPTLAQDAVLRMAMVCWSIDADHGMTPSQHFWITTRLKDQTPLTPVERTRLRKPLLAWCMHLGGERLVAIVWRQYDEATSVLQEVFP